MTSIYLIRHGQASFGQENYDQLSELGEIQAHILGESLSQRIENFDQVIVGAMLRHEQTAVNCLSHFENPLVDQESPLAEQKSPSDQLDGPLADRDAVYDAAWNEYDHEQILLRLRPELGSMKELMALMAKQVDPKNALRKYFSDAVARWMSGNHDTDYSESWNDFTRRVQGALQRVVSANSSDSMRSKNIAVFTSGGPISVVSQSLLGVPKEKIMQMNWTLLNCAVTKLVVTRSHTFLATLNEHTHFEGPGHKHLLTYT